MANKEQLSILSQGSEVWNKWREENADHIDLRRANLTEVNLAEANLRDADFTSACLVKANLSKANLGRTDLVEAQLKGANLKGAYLYSADLSRAELSGIILTEGDLRRACLVGANLVDANLSKADLVDADLREANLREADLSRADLAKANLRGANLTLSNLAKAQVGNSIFGSSDLSETIGLEDIVHRGPSSISVDAFALSKGQISEVFLKGCGLSNADIEYVKLSNPELTNEEINETLYKMYDLRAGQALQISPLFISYNHADSMYVDKLELHLDRRGVRFWRDIHKATAGRMEKVIDRAIRQNPTVLLVLSKHSLNSDWVEHEVRTARALEKEMGRDVLCPIALDDSWKNSKWEKHVMEQVMKYHILDFSNWRDDSKFDGIFRKLIDGLELFYKG